MSNIHCHVLNTGPTDYPTNMKTALRFYKQVSGEYYKQHPFTINK